MMFQEYNRRRRVAIRDAGEVGWRERRNVEEERQRPRKTDNK